MEPKKSKITVRNVSRCFLSPEGKRIDAVQDIKFNVEDAYSREGRDIGEFRVLLGPSGCGKSTLLRMIAGLDRPDTGEVLVNDQPVHGPGRDRGMVFQKYTSFPWLTVAGNIAYGLKINGVSDAKRKETVAQLIEAVGLKGSRSTLLRMIAGLDRPDTGEVLVNDQPVHGPGRDRGMVFQKYTSFPWLTVAGNIAYGLKINGVSDAKRKETVAQLIEAVGLKGF